MLRRITAQGGQCLPDGVRKSQTTYGRKTMKHVFIAALSLFMIGGVLPASASTIYIQNSGTGLIGSEFVGGGDLTRYGADYPWSVGWTQTGTYTNVSISADVNIVGSPGDPANGKPTDTGLSFLTTQVGSGTTVANQIASGTFAGPSNWGSQPHTQLDHPVHRADPWARDLLPDTGHHRVRRRLEGRQLHIRLTGTWPWSDACWFVIRILRWYSG